MAYRGTLKEMEMALSLGVPPYRKGLPLVECHIIGNWPVKLGAYYG